VVKSVGGSGSRIRVNIVIRKGEKGIEDRRGGTSVRMVREDAVTAISRGYSELEIPSPRRGWPRRGLNSLAGRRKRPLRGSDHKPIRGGKWS